MSAVIGLTFTASSAKESPDKMLSFNAIVRKRKLLPTANFPNTGSSARSDWLPDTPSSKIADQYVVVENTWLTPDLGADAAQKAADIWVEAFGWSPKASNKPPPLPTGYGMKRMVGGTQRAKSLASIARVLETAPKNLIESLDEFLATGPMITVGQYFAAWFGRFVCGRPVGEFSFMRRQTSYVPPQQPDDP